MVEWVELPEEKKLPKARRGVYEYTDYGIGSLMQLLEPILLVGAIMYLFHWFTVIRCTYPIPLPPDFRVDLLVFPGTDILIATVLALASLLPPKIGKNYVTMKTYIPREAE